MQKPDSEIAVRSFEEVYKTAYSHGLESIYKLENIDLKSVRRLGVESSISPTASSFSPSPSLAPTSVSKKSSPPSANLEEWDEEFDFGPQWGGYTSPFVVKEPLQILRLSRHTEKCLLEEGLKTLGDLRSVDLNRLVFVKGLGQGHVEEVKERLLLHMEGKPLKRAYEIDFSSWIAQVVGEIEPKLAYLLLEPYRLSDGVPLTPLEAMELKRMTLEKKQDLREEGRGSLQNPDRVKEVLIRFEEIEQIFLIPWIEERGGAITEDELLECLQRVSLDPKLTEPALRFFSDHFTSRPFPFSLHKEGLLYFSSSKRWKEFYDLETRLLSYFWSEEAQVPLEDLYRWISSDLLPEWEFIEVKTLKRLLALSSKLKREKGVCGQLLIKRANRYVRT